MISQSVLVDKLFLSNYCCLEACGLCQSGPPTVVRLCRSQVERLHRVQRTLVGDKNNQSNFVDALDRYVSLSPCLAPQTYQKHQDAD